MKYRVEQTSRFKKELRTMLKRGKDRAKLLNIAIDNGALFLSLTRTGTHSDLF